jgi:hypothetical protein
MSLRETREARPMSSLHRVTFALLVGFAPLLAASAASAAPDPKASDIEMDVPAAPTGTASPTTTPPVDSPKREQPPTPAHPHTELQSGPPTADQTDQWPVVPKAKDAAGPLSFPIIRPYASIVGGVSVDVPIQYQVGKEPSSNIANRVSTIMMSDFGVRGALLPWISFESEIMANGGVSLHGTSVFEGQASLQVRKQVLHLGKDWWTVEVGRVVDEASVDYFSYHIADTFLMDPATEPFLLFDGFNLGNGVRGTAEVLEGLRLGFTFNAGNPTSSSSILAFGGSYPPYPNIFTQASQSTLNNASAYPTDQFQAYVFTPSLLYKNKVFEAKTALQYFFVNPDALNGTSPTLHGYNYRINASVHLLDDMIVPFANFNYGENDTVVGPGNGIDQISANRYTGIGVGGGVDFNYQKKFGNYNGVGAMFVQDESQVGSTGIITRNRYYNVGTTYWLAPMVAAGLRFAEYTSEQLNQIPSTTPTPSTGNRSVLMTLRLVL